MNWKLSKPTSILVICTGNSCRSQMAEGYFRKLGGSRVEVASAGTEAHGLNPRAVQVMQEDGIDISGHTSDTIEKYRDRSFDYVITVCDSARENCPWFPGGKILHQSFPDPADATGTDEAITQVYREVRNGIGEYVRNFLTEHLPGQETA